MTRVDEARAPHTFSRQQADRCGGEAVKVSLFKGSNTESDRINSTISPNVFQDPQIQEFMREETTFLGQKASNGDIMLLMFEIMKMFIEAGENEKVARNEERRMQLQNLEKEVANYKSQAKWMLFGHIGAGILGIGSGLAPIVGHTHGKSILGALQVFDRFKGLKVGRLYNLSI